MGICCDVCKDKDNCKEKYSLTDCAECWINLNTKGDK